jgi:hypothetical protein
MLAMNNTVNGIYIWYCYFQIGDKPTELPVTDGVPSVAQESKCLFIILITYIADWEPLYDEIWLHILNKEHKMRKRG